MRRLVRSVSTFLAVLFLLVAVAAAGMWARSLFTSDSVPRLIEANQLQVSSAAGRLVFFGTRDDHATTPGRLLDVRWLRVGEDRVPLPGIDRALRQRLVEERGTLKTLQFTVRTRPAALGNGFGFDADVHTITGGWYVIVPYWAVVVLALVIPLGVFGARALCRRRERRAAAAGTPGDAPAPSAGEKLDPRPSDT